MDEWYSLYKGGVGEIEEKKSRFIATIEPVTSVEDANAFIGSIKKQYWDAKHNCSAYIIGDDGQQTRCSDDGEPSGTAGRPMLEVLAGEKITNICVVVTRYFGGTLLGTGGLVRAYQGAVKAGLEKCSILKRQSGAIMKVTCDYTDLAKLQFISGKNDYYTDDVIYENNVVMKLIIEASRIAELESAFMDASSGRAIIEKEDMITYALIDGKPMIL